MQYTTCMQRIKAMVERIEVDPLDNLHIIDDVNINFLIRSQIIHESWFALNLGIECCEEVNGGEIHIFEAHVAC